MSSSDGPDSSPSNPSPLFAELSRACPQEMQQAVAATRPAELRAAAPSSSSSCIPPGFPVQARCARYENWSLAIDVPNLCIAEVASDLDVATVANWAAGAGYTVRALGQSHNWSPLVVPGSTPKVILVDTQALNGMTFNPDPDYPTATFGTGVTVDAATLFLQQQDNGDPGAAPGFSFLNMTAPGDLSLGGALAIGGHGTGVPFQSGGQPVPEPPLNGCLSNLIVSFKAVVTQPGSQVYTVQEFSRGDAAAAAFLVHLGRAFLTEVTLRVVPNYYLQVNNSYTKADILFGPPDAGSDLSFSSLLDRYGRVEAIWYPFTDEPWVKTWQLMSAKIEPQVAGPFNYPWSDSITVGESNAIKWGIQTFPSTTPTFGETQLVVTQLNAPAGAVMNGTSRDLLLYIKPSTLRVTAFGYAVQVPRGQVQQVLYDFAQQYTSMLASYQNAGKYPVNSAVEVRVTTMDLTDDLGVAGATPAALSVCRSINPSDPALDTVVWVDSLTLPGTASSDEFFIELESWMASKWGVQGNLIMRPEWSKGWAFSPQGAWTNTTILTEDIPAEYNQPAAEDLFAWAVTTLAEYDASHIYTNSFLDVLLP